ncbi:MAG: DUF4925 domain-containing protein [Muribaculaceae bacterium]|nr:DUF4925 domain-containing protein [Muribaculaceae bacterium]
MLNLYRFLPAMGLALLLGSCSDDKDTVALPDFSTSKTYTGNNLELYYNNELMPGKSADVKLEDGNLNIRFYQTFDLSQLSGMGLTGSLPGPGVTPGDDSLTLRVPVNADSGRYSIAGFGETDAVTFSYTGEVTSERMIFSISDAKLKNTIFAGSVFAPAPIEKSGLVSYSSLPFHLVWEIDPAVGFDLPLSEILKIMVTAPVIPVYNNTAYTSVAQAFENVVKSVALTDSGDIPVMFISTLGGAAHLATSSGNMLQYIPSDNGLKLYVNPLSALGQVLLYTSDNKNDEKFDFAAMLKKTPRAVMGSDDETSNAAGMDPALTKAMVEVLIKALAPQISGGVPLTVEPTAKGADIYISTETSVTFLATVLQYALANPAIAGALQEAIGSSNIPQLSPEDLAGLLQKLPQFLEATTKLEIGLSFVKDL